MWIGPTLKNDPYVLSGVVCIHCVGYMPRRFVCVGLWGAGGFTAENCVCPHEKQRMLFLLLSELAVAFSCDLTSRLGSTGGIAQLKPDGTR